LVKPVLIIHVPKEKKRFVKSLVEKYRRNAKQGLVLGEVVYSDTAVYFMVPEEALSAAFAYSVYLRAKEKSLNVEAMYAVSIDLESVLPEDVKRIGLVWTSRRLSKEEIKLLKNRFITPNILEVILK